MLLGDAISTALERVGISKKQVSTWLGRPCGCEARQSKLNALGLWATRQLKSSVKESSHWLTLVTDGILSPLTHGREKKPGD